MADNIADVLQELSGLLRRISNQQNEQAKPAVDGIGCNTLENMELLSRAGSSQKDESLRRPVMETLEHQNHLLETLIARLREKPGKG